MESHGSELPMPPSLIEQLHQLTDEFAEDDNPQQAAFLDHYFSLSEIDSEELHDLGLSIELSDGSEITMTPLGEVNLGPIYLVESQDESYVAVLAGSVLTTGPASLYKQRIKKIDKTAKKDRSELLGIMRTEENTASSPDNESTGEVYDIFTRGICQEAHLVLYRLYGVDDIAQRPNFDPDSPINKRYLVYRKKLGTQAEDMTLYVDKKPTISEATIRLAELIGCDEDPEDESYFDDEGDLT